MYYDKQIETAKTPLELGQYIDLDMEDSSIGSGGACLDPLTLSLAIRSAVGICRDNPRLVFPDIPNDAVGLQNWCIKAQRIYEAGSSPDDGAEPKKKDISRRFKLAMQAYKETLLFAEKNGKILDADREQIYAYGKEYLNTDYKWPKSFELWNNYLNGYYREAEEILKQQKSV